MTPHMPRPPQLTPELLIDPVQGLNAVYKAFPKIKFKGRGHEVGRHIELHPSKQPLTLPLPVLPGCRHAQAARQVR